MGNINWGRVLLGGLLACLMINLLGSGLDSLLLREGELGRAMRVVRPLPPWRSSIFVLLIGIVVTFLVGAMMVWWYAAIRPRFGPGPKTAALAGFAFWLTASPVQIFVGGDTCSSGLCALW